MSNRTYDILKYIALIVLPAAATLYTTLAGLWHLPHPAEVSGTITAFMTCLGVLLGISSADYTPPTAGTLFVNGEDVYATFGYKPKHLAEGSSIVQMEVKNVTDE